MPRQLGDVVGFRGDRLFNGAVEAVVKELITACDVDSTQELLTALEQQDEHMYAKIHDFFAAQGMSIRALAGESIRDVVDIIVREYCGKGKPYRSLVILFDEFGKYTEFATVHSQIAGSGVLQDLFEATQSHADSVCFVGFIQFELNAYVQRVAPEYKNEILRYVTRYQAANRVYLSINLETLIASLLEKRQRKLLDEWFADEQVQNDSRAAMTALARWFPQVMNHRLWRDPDQFHSVICKGCWPLSPYSTWFLFYLAAAGKHLQERSVLALLEDAFHRFEKTEVPDTGDWSLSPADLWSDSLQQELISSEEMGQQGSITHAYASVIARHGTQLSSEMRKLLCAVEASISDAQLPWSVTEVISTFAARIEKERKQASLSWIQQFESDAEALSTMQAAEAIRLHDRASTPPAFLTEQHGQRLSRLRVRIDARLETLKIDWLVEEFKKLPPDARKRFLRIISDLPD